MGMFDTYKPANALMCPVCGRRLTQWQGKDGPNALLVWEEGRSSPADQDVDDELRLPPVEVALLRLPARFLIYSYDCPDHQPVEAVGMTVSGTWSSTEMLPWRDG